MTDYRIEKDYLAAARERKTLREIVIERCLLIGIHHEGHEEHEETRRTERGSGLTTKNTKRHEEEMKLRGQCKTTPSSILRVSSVSSVSSVPSVVYF